MFRFKQVRSAEIQVGINSVLYYKVLFVCLFVLRLNVPVNNFSVMSGRSHRFLGT